MSRIVIDIQILESVSVGLRAVNCLETARVNISLVRQFLNTDYNTVLSCVSQDGCL
jgi:hypothetical protein